MGAEARGVKWPRIELEKRDAWLNTEQRVEASVTYTHPLLHRSKPTALQKVVLRRITILYSHQWCSLRDTQVYAVYPLGKVNDLRIPTLKSARIRNNIIL